MLTFTMMHGAGNPVVCLNLVKASEKRPRETLLRTEFQNAIQYLNQRVRAATDHAQVATGYLFGIPSAAWLVCS